MKKYEVVVGNVGSVLRDGTRTEAERVFKAYVRISESGKGRAGYEPVTMLCDGELVKEYLPAIEEGLGDMPDYE